jgi:hypothetical protein
MSDTLPVADLEPPTRPRSVVPFLWLAIMMLSTGAVTAAATGAADRREPDPQARLATAAGVLEEVDFAFEVTLALEGSDTQANGFTIEGAYDADTRRVRGTVEAAGQEMEFIQDGAFQYLHVPAGSPLTETAAGKSWLRIDFTGVIDEAALTTPVGENPLDTFARLGKITGPIERVGEERVRGVPTVHFRTTVDASRGMTDAESLRNVLVDVWLDDDDRPRRHRQTMTLDDPGGTTVVSTMESFDYGKAVTIELPPADQVGDFDTHAIVEANLDALTKPSD